MRVEWRSLDDLTALCRANVGRVRELKPDVIVGIPRSGMLPATQLALALGLPLADLHSFCRGDVWARGGGSCGLLPGKRVLLVEDATGYGKSMRGAVARVKDEFDDTVELITCGVYATPAAVPKLDIALEALARPRLFEWNWWRNGWLDQCCVDIDGVLCEDPTREQRNDERLYLEFLTGAKPLFVAKKPIHALVTARRERYRSQTVEWLARHGIQYSYLFMQTDDAPRLGIHHAEMKARVYGSSPAARLFLESSEAQAAHIFERCRKDVLCITTRKLFKC